MYINIYVIKDIHTHTYVCIYTFHFGKWEKKFHSSFSQVTNPRTNPHAQTLKPSSNWAVCVCVCLCVRVRVRFLLCALFIISHLLWNESSDRHFKISLGPCYFRAYSSVYLLHGVKIKSNWKQQKQKTRTHIQWSANTLLAEMHKQAYSPAQILIIKNYS